MATPKTAATMVLQALTFAGHEAYFVGGCVRDTLLGLKPKDWDVTTSASSEQVLELFGEKAKMVGAHFGVALVDAFGHNVEVATFRTDGSYSDNRRPDSVTFTCSVQEDVQRRDFTVNALLMDADGTVHDYVGGQADLNARVLRTVGNPMDRFNEDALRMLRAVRFACKLDFELDVMTLGAMQVMSNKVLSVSAERVAVELTGILTSGHADKGVRLLHDAYLLHLLLPEVSATQHVKQNPLHHPEGDVYVHTLGLLAGLTKNCEPTLAFAALLHDVGKPSTAAVHPVHGQPTFYGHEDVGAQMAANVMKRLKLSTDFADAVVGMVAQHMRFNNVSKMKQSKLKMFVRQPKFDQLLELHRLDAQASSKDYSDHQFVVDFLASTPEEALRPTKLLSGDDLVAMGFKPGPMFKTVLSALECAQLDSTVTTRSAAELFVQQHFAV